jgi:hypothetical protein
LLLCVHAGVDLALATSKTRLVSMRRRTRPMMRKMSSPNMAWKHTRMISRRTYHILFLVFVFVLLILLVFVHFILDLFVIFDFLHR